MAKLIHLHYFFVNYDFIIPHQLGHNKKRNIESRQLLRVMSQKFFLEMKGSVPRQSDNFR